MSDRQETSPRLLYVSTLDHIVRVMLPHLDGAQAAGYRVDVACRFTRFTPDVAAHADALHDVPMRRFPLHPANLVSLIQIIRLIRRERYDIVHCHNPTGGIVGRLAATLARTRDYKPLRVYTAHGFHFHRHGGRVTNFVYKSIETWAGYFLSDAVLTINREDYDAARGHVVPADKLFLTSGVGVSAREDFDPSRVTATHRDAIRAEFGADGDTAIITVVGEMIGRKRHADALTAFAKILPRHPNALLVLVGDGALSDSIKAKADALGITTHCRFPGFRRDVPAILAASDVFLFPSQQEGLPCSVQEALSMGVPTVATDVRGNRDLVNNECGQLVPLGDTGALASAVVEILDKTNAERHVMGAAGRAAMLRLYDRPHCVAEWLGIYKTILTQSLMEKS